MYRSLFPEQTRALSPDTVAEALNVLRYLQVEFGLRGTIDHINMRHVTAALSQIDSELTQGGKPQTFAVRHGEDRP